MPQGSRRERGFALLMVLWTLMLLAFLATVYGSNARTEVLLARNLVTNARAEALADAGIYRAATFPLKRDAERWAAEIEGQAHHIRASGFAPPPRDATLADLIDKYLEQQAKEPGKTKAATLRMLKRDLGKVKLSSLSASVYSIQYAVAVTPGSLLLSLTS